MKLEAKAKMLRIHFGEADKWKDNSLCRAIVEKCRQLDIAGATVRCIDGYGAVLSFSPDAPIMVSVIDTEDKVQYGCGKGGWLAKISHCFFTSL